MRRPRNDALGTQDLQHRNQRRMRLTRRAQRAAQAVAARQVVAKELVDAAFVEHARWQLAHRHPVREVRYGVQPAPGGVGGITAAPQSRDVGRDLGGQWAFEEPGPQGRVQRRNLGHDGLQRWSRQCCASSRFMSSAARGRTADRKRWRGKPAYATPELLITGGFS